MAGKNWTTKEIQYIKNKALFAETNEVLNAEQLAKTLSRSLNSVKSKIYNMQKDEQLPSVDRSKSFDTESRPFTTKEDKRLIAMYKQGAGSIEIGEALGRKASSITGRVYRLRKNGKLKVYSRKNWSDEEVQKLVDHIQFDEYGYVSNYPELAQVTNKPYSQIQQKVSNLRKQGAITVQADKTKTSVKSKKAMDNFNCARFGKRMEGDSVPQPIAETDVKVETQSKVIQIIMTTVITGNEKTINFFSTDGELLMAKKEPVSSANDTSHKQILSI